MADKVLTGVVVDGVVAAVIPVPLQSTPASGERKKSWADTADAVIIVAAVIICAGGALIFGFGASGHLALTPTGYAYDGTLTVVSGLLAYFAWKTGLLSLKEEVDHFRQQNVILTQNNTAYAAQNLQYHGMLLQGQEQLKARDTQIQQSQEQLVSLQSTASNLQSRVVEYESQLSEGQKQIEERGRQLEVSQKEVEALTNVRDNLQESSLDLQKQIDEHRNLLKKNQEQIAQLETLNQALNASTVMLAKGEKAAAEMLKAQEDLFKRERQLQVEREELFRKEQELVSRQEEETKLLIDVQARLSASENRLQELVSQLATAKGKLLVAKLDKKLAEHELSWDHFKRALLIRAAELRAIEAMDKI